jgi:hypothetical protein
VRFQLKAIQTNALLKKAGLMGNNRKAPVPALQREPQVEPDSSEANVVIPLVIRSAPLIIPCVAAVYTPGGTVK